MAYRFNLSGFNVECDTAEDLCAAMPSPGELLQTTSQSRARKVKTGKKVARVNTKTKKKTAVPAMTAVWDRARAYAEKKKIPVQQAFKEIAASPRKRAAADRLLATK